MSDPQHPYSDSCGIIGDHDHEGYFHGVFAPSWGDDQLLVHLLRDEAESQASDRDLALFLHLADRIESLGGFAAAPTPEPALPNYDGAWRSQWLPDPSVEETPQPERESNDG